MNVFKAYSSKANANRAAKKVGQEAIEQDGQWGIMVPAEVTLEQAKAEAQLDAEVATEAQAPALPLHPELVVVLANLEQDGLGGTCPHCSIDLSNGVAFHGDAVNPGKGGSTIVLETGSYACMACWGEWGPAPLARGEAPDMATLPLEAHGVKRPQRAGLCWEVWELAYRLQAGTGELPTVATMRAEAPHLNPTNVQIEYYNWRKYNGVRGRQAKA